MSRDEAIVLLEQFISNKNLMKHMLAVEAVMRRLAVHFNEDVETWGLAGLLHDLDYELTVNAPEQHGFAAAKMLAPYALPSELVEAVISHPGHVPQETRIAQALHAADPITGLIVASVLMLPGKKMNMLSVPFVMKRFREKRFAAGANREQIRSCERLGVALETFVGLAVEAMQSIDKELGFS